MSFLLNLNAAQLLVLADDLELSDFLYDILVDAGYNAQKAYTLDDARFMVGYTQFDLALIDGAFINKASAPFQKALQGGRLFGKLPWICIIDQEAAKPAIQGNAPLVMLAQSGYSPQSVLSTVARTLDQNGGVQPNIVDDEAAAAQSAERETRRIFERKLLEHQTLSSIARMLNSTLDLTTVLTKVVDAATSLTDAEEGLLLLPDDEGKKLFIRAAKGIDSDTAKEFRIKTEDTLAGQVFKSGQPVLIGDSGWQKVKTEYFVKSLLYVPMLFKESVIGVLGVNNRTDDHTFTAHDRDLLLDLASHAAIAIENARLYGESIQQRRELAILFAASQAVNSTLALDEVLAIISEQIANALDIGWCDITTYEEQTQALHHMASYQRAQWQIKQISRGDTDQPPALYKTIQQRQRLYLTPNTARDNRHNLRYLLSKHAVLLCLFPLVTEHRAIGVFELVYCHRPPEGLQSISSSTIQQQALQLMVAIDSRSINTVEAQTIAQQLLSDTGASFCALHLWDENQERFHKRWSFGQAVWTKEHPVTFKLKDYPVLRTVIEQSQPTHLTRHDQDEPDVARLLDYFGARTLLAIPLLITGEVSGVVFLADTIQQRHYDEREIDMANALIVQAANAMKNAWLFQDLQRSLDELRQAQSKLIQAARLSAMGELAAAVAHQINNPLTTVIADTEMVLADLDETDHNHESLLAVHRAGKRAHEVVRRLLGMAHQQDDENPPQPLDVNATIRNTLALVSRNIERQQIKIEAQLADNLPKVYGVSGQLEDVWMNLLLNARDAVMGQENPRMRIRSRLSSNGQAVVIEVWDNGTGIPEDKCEDIFTAFFTTKPPGEGTGLGLHICQQVVEKCGGRIRLKHTSPQGTTFEVRLPAT